MSALVDLSRGRSMLGDGPDPRLDRGRLSRRALRLVGLLGQRGVRPGDRVVLACDNSSEFIVALLALMHLDVSIVVMDPSLRDQGVTERCRQADVTALVISSSERSLDGVPVLVVGPDTVAEDAPSGGATLDFSAWWARADALVVFSSGTTGAPCAIARTGRGLRANLDRTVERMGYRQRDVLLPLLPYSHQYGLSLLLLWWLTGCCLVVVAPTALATALQAVDDHGVTVVDATPSSYHSLLRLITRRPTPGIDGVRMWCVGGSPTGSSFRDTFAAATGRPLLDGYGSSELGNIALAGPEDPLACGRPLDGVGVRVIDEAGTPVPPGTVGHVVVSSHDGMSAFRPWGEDWQAVDESEHATGDLGQLDLEGRLTVIGRARAVHRLGLTVYPEAIALRAEAAGAPVEIVTIPDERIGHRLILVVADPDGAGAAHWRDRVRAVLDPPDWPNQVVVLGQLPLGATGKVDRVEVEALVRARLDLRERSARSAEPERVHQLLRPARPTETGPDLRLLAQRWPALVRVADLLEERHDEVVTLLTSVIGHRCAEEEIAATITTLRGAREEIELFRPDTVSSTAVFMPSNIPLYAYALYVLVPALYSERVVFRPSSHIRQACVALHEFLQPVHGLDVTLNDGTQREFLDGPVAESSVVVFTGTYANAETIRATLRPEQLMLFFGQGINPVVIGRSADIDRSADDVVSIRMINNGQDCFGPDVVLVHDDVADEFVAAVRSRLTRLRYGPYVDPSADYGPLLYDAALGTAVSHLHRAADAIVHGGSVHLRERHLEPTVLRRPLPAKLTCDELFAPIFNVVTYADDAALHRVLRSPYFEERAMGAMVYGVEPATIDLLRERHQVCVDTTLLSEDDGNRPFGGRGIRANYVAIDGTRRAEPLLVSKAISDHLRDGATDVRRASA